MLNILTALIAFAAVMIILSTLVTVIIEALQKIFRKRREGFQEMMESLYRDVISNWSATARQNGDAGSGDAEGNEAPSQSAASVEFTSQMMRNPTYDRRRYGLRLRNWFDWIFKPDFENMDTRQFIEQLANTEAAQKLKGLAKAELQKKLEQAAYQFERYGDAASDYFGRRASAASVIVAIGLAFAINVDTFQLFAGLARDRALSEMVIANLDKEVERRADAQAPPDERSPELGTDVQPAAASPDADRKTEQYTDLRSRIRSDVGMLAALGLPIGRGYFPFCREPALDPRCPTEEARDPKAPKMLQPQQTQGTDQGVGKALIDAARRTLSEVGEIAARVWSVDGLIWSVSVLLAGGLIGLGAPFWFDVYRTFSAFVPAAEVASQFVKRRPETEATETAGKAPATIRRAEETSMPPEELVRVFALAGNLETVETGRRRRPV